MKIVNTFDEVRTYITKVRGYRKGFLTNFFPERRKVEIWTSHECLYVIDFEETVLFLKKDDDFTYIFYCSTTKVNLLKTLEKLPKDVPYVFDQIVDARTDSTLVDSFRLLGFNVRKSLVRMSKINESKEVLAPNNSFIATENDIQEIYYLLHEHFDKYAEQIPTKEELCDFITTNHSLLFKIEGIIAGFILFDQTPSTSCLRYWFVNPKYRNQGVGSALFHEYIKRCAACSRHLLWVVEDNENAVKRYEHYGYKTEKLKDYVLTINV